MAARKQAPKKLKPAHPDLIPGLERLGLPTDEVSRDEVAQHPIYFDILFELLAKKVPA